MAKNVVHIKDFKQRFIDWWNNSDNGKESWRDDLAPQVVESFAQCGVEVFDGPPIAFCNHCYKLFITPDDDPGDIYCSQICEEAQTDL